MAYNYNSKPTGTKNKIGIEEKTYYKVIDRLLPNPRKWWIGLVGHAVELPRHIQMCSNIGIPPDRMMIVERDKRICADLRKATNRCLVKEGEFIDILRKYISSYRFSLIDYDATGGLSQNEIDLIDIYRRNPEHGILRIVTSARSKTDPDFENLSDQSGIEKLYRGICMTPEIKQKILSQCQILKARNRILNDKDNSLPIYTFTYQSEPIILAEYCDKMGLYCLFENYKGRSNMRNIVISKNPALLNQVYTDIISSESHLEDISIGGNQIRKFYWDHELTIFYQIGKEIYYGQELVAIL